MVKFYSVWEDTIIEAEVLETRKYTVKLRLGDGNIIVKKISQLVT